MLLTSQEHANKLGCDIIWCDWEPTITRCQTCFLHQNCSLGFRHDSVWAVVLYAARSNVEWTRGKDASSHISVKQNMAGVIYFGRGLETDSVFKPPHWSGTCFLLASTSLSRHESNNHVIKAHRLYSNRLIRLFTVQGHSDLQCEHNVVILTFSFLAPVAAQPLPHYQRGANPLDPVNLTHTPSHTH